MQDFVSYLAPSGPITLMIDVHSNGKLLRYTYYYMMHHSTCLIGDGSSPSTAPG